MIHNWQDITVTENATLRDAMSILSRFSLRIVLVRDDHGHLIGTITDGDIRRGLLKSLTLNDAVAQIMNRSPLVAFPYQTIDIVHDILRQHSILAIPIIDNERKIIGLETIESTEATSGIDIDVVLMAGGIGKRLLPLTQLTPKPMLPLKGSKPMLESIIEEFVRQGFRRFYISTHYKPEVIRNYFKDGKGFGCTIHYTHEQEPLGTAGALSLLKEKLNNSFIVMNADLSVKINYRNLIEFHQHHNALATMCVRRMEYQVPYGVVELEDLHIRGIQEKPHHAYLINAGIYCFDNEIMGYITHNRYLDMDILFQRIIQDRKKVNAFPIHEDWVDIGRLDDYKKNVSQ